MAWLSGLSHRFCFLCRKPARGKGGDPFSERRRLVLKWEEGGGRGGHLCGGTILPTKPRHGTITDSGAARFLFCRFCEAAEIFPAQKMGQNGCLELFGRAFHPRASHGDAAENSSRGGQVGEEGGRFVDG